ncbi:hypothetical protein [Roseibium album]|uniref:hypothetical protein n=1 Tax=Roseibium album TaxID=311410 RepID=UPI00248F80AF|nr:hypothetical protein [Roseibium album]
MNKNFWSILVFGLSLSLSSALALASDTKKKCKGQREVVKILDCIKKTDTYKPYQIILPKGTGGSGGNIHPGQSSTYSR